MPSGLHKIYAAFACGGKRRKGDKHDKHDKPDTATERGLSEKAAATAAASDSTLAVDALHAELDEARAQIAQWRGKALALEQEIAALQSAAEAHARREEEVAAELAALQAANGELASRRASACMKGEDQQRALDAEVRRAEEERERLQREMDGHRRTREALDAARAQMEEAGRELAQLRTKQQAMEADLARRSADKRASAVTTREPTESAAPTPGAASTEDAQRRIERLNAEILELSALVTDRTVFAKRESEHSAGFKKAYDAVEACLGREMARRLTSATNAEDAIWVQMALQAIVARVAGRMIECWDVALESKQNELLTEIHNAILANEPLAVSLRWRALTRRYVQRPDHDDTLQSETDTVLSLFQGVLLVSGMQHDRPLPDWTGFRARVLGLLRGVLAVQRALGEEGVASDFRVIHPPPAAPFAPDAMRDVDACEGDDRAPPRAAPVLCTTELGLENYEEVEEARVKRSVVLKAGVALHNGPAQT